MKSLKVIQLGDVHLNEQKNTVIGDHKDKAAPGSVVNATFPKRIQLVIRKIAEIAENASIRGLLLCGDLASKGDHEEYRKCIEFLDQALEVCNPKKWPDESMHVVPGNHDVDRKLCDPKGIDLYGKFNPLITSWEKHGRNEILPVQNIRSTVIKPNGHSLNLFSLNSCIGCGERRHLPNKIRDELEELLKKHSKSALPEDAFNLLGEQLDTPAFVDDHVDVLVKKIENVAETSVPIVLAHHNALPQAIPRVEIYTDLINAGLFRSRLASCSRSIIYCHGHIHSDPVEQLVDYSYPSSNVIFVSAPLLVNGFNIIEIEFARNNLPLGCIIHKYCLTNHGSVDNRESVSVPLIGSEKMPHFNDNKLRALVDVCGPENIRFENLRNLINNELGIRLIRDTVRDLIVEAEWLNLVKVSDRKLDYKYWCVRRLEP